MRARPEHRGGVPAHLPRGPPTGGHRGVPATPWKPSLRLTLPQAHRLACRLCCEDGQGAWKQGRLCQGRAQKVAPQLLEASGPPPGWSGKLRPRGAEEGRAGRGLAGTAVPVVLYVPVSNDHSLFSTQRKTELEK